MKRRAAGAGLGGIALILTGLGAAAVAVPRWLPGLELVGKIHEPVAVHADQAELDARNATDPAGAFRAAFDLGSDLFETHFNALDGVGANVGDGSRFTRVPRADLDGYGQWKTHFPPRTTGPNAESCVDCHNQPTNDGAGRVVANVVRDPFQRGELRSFITRNTPHTFAPGAVQRLAEEMTQRLHAIAEHAQATACSRGRPQRAPLVAKGVSFGVIRARCDRLDTSQVVGVDSDLVVKPFQWKGSVASLRTFTRDAFHRELGMQPVELVGAGVDGDFDGVVDEISVGDVTAMTVYLAAQPRPTTKLELAALGLQELDASEAARIRTGEQVFERAQCSDCHRPALTLRDPIFREPSVDEHYRDAVLPAGQAPGAVGLDAARPLRFDLSADQPDNRIEVNGATIRLGALEKDERGRALVRLYGDLKRHDMGPGLAERVDEVGTGASVFLTENLWGVGSTPPYLHDGRATTLTEAILAHGGEAETSRRAFESLPLDEQRALVAFLGNLVLFVAE